MSVWEERHLWSSRSWTEPESSLLFLPCVLPHHVPEERFRQEGPWGFHIPGWLCSRLHQAKNRQSVCRSVVWPDRRNPGSWNAVAKYSSVPHHHHWSPKLSFLFPWNQTFTLGCRKNLSARRALPLPIAPELSPSGGQREALGSVLCGFTSLCFTKSRFSGLLGKEHILCILFLSPFPGCSE